MAAALAQADPRAFARAWGLGEAALLRRLGRLEHLTLSRGFLLDLQAACRERQPSSPLLTTWRPWPVRLAYSWANRRAVGVLDGAATLIWRGDSVEPRAAPVVLVWDDGGGLALEVVRPRLVALLRARAARARAAVRERSSPFATATEWGFPTVLLVASGPERAWGAWSLALDLARAERLPPLPLLVTSAPALRHAGVADAPWHDQDGQASTQPPCWPHTLCQKAWSALWHAQVRAPPLPVLMVCQTSAQHGLACWSRVSSPADPERFWPA